MKIFEPPISQKFHSFKNNDKTNSLDYFSTWIVRYIIHSLSFCTFCLLCANVGDVGAPRTFDTLIAHLESRDTDGELLLHASFASCYPYTRSFRATLDGVDAGA